jgi:hypothetical protein
MDEPASGDYGTFMQLRSTLEIIATQNEVHGE